MKSLNLFTDIFNNPQSSTEGTGSISHASAYDFEVLVVDDDEMTRNLIGRLLDREFNGISTTYKENGVEALKYALENQPALIILDLMLPGMNGFEILRKLRKEKALEKTKVLLLSAKSSSEDIEKGFELTADEYVTKPFQPGEFLVRVRKLLQSINAGN